MPYQRGSEELYRGMRPGNYDQDTLGLIRGNAARQLDQSRELSNMYSSGIAEEGQHLGDTIAAIPGAFGQGMGMRQGYERHGAGMQQHGQGMQKGEREIKRLDQVNELGGMQTEEARMSMDKAKRLNDYDQQPGSKPGRTREQDKYDQPFQQGTQNLAIGNQQLLNMKDQAAQVKVSRAAQGYAQAYRNPDNITAMAEADGMARNLGLTAQEVLEAKNQGKQLKGSADATQNMLYQFSPQGIDASQQMAAINRDNQALNEAKLAHQQLKDSWAIGRFGGENTDANRAIERAQNALQNVGVPFDPGLSSEANLAKAIRLLEQRTASKTSYLRKSGANMAPEAQNRLNGLEAAIPGGFNEWAGQGGGGQGGASSIDKVLQGNSQGSPSRPFSPVPAAVPPQQQNPGMGAEEMRRGFQSGPTGGSRPVLQLGSR